MQKAVYSLILSEDVVAAVDRLAYRNNTNRSNMINQILAEYVSYETPEMRMRQIFGRMEALLCGGDTFRLLSEPSGTALSLRSALAFKYNPTVRYAVELYRAPERGCVGELRVFLRSRNNTLLLYVTRFFDLWAALEERYGGIRRSSVGEGKLVRALVPRTSDGEMSEPDSAAEAISRYIEALDGGMKLYFSAPDAKGIEGTVAEYYLGYLSRGGGNV